MDRIPWISYTIGVFIISLIVFLLPTSAAPSDPHAIAAKYGMDLKELKPEIFGIGTLAPADTPWIRFPLERIVRKVKEETDGFLRIQIFAGGSMGDDSDVLEKIKSHKLQGCGCTAQGMYEAVPELSVLSLPFLFKNYNEVDYILKTFRKDIDDMFMKRGYRLFGIVDTGFLHLFTRNKISSFEDIQKQKLATWFGEIERTTLDALGTKYIPILVPETSTSFKTGLIDGNLAPASWMLATQAFLYTRYVMETPIFYAPTAIFVDDRQLKELEKKYPQGSVKEMLDYVVSVVVQSEKDWRAEIRDYEKKCMYAYLNSGRTPVILPKSDIDKLNDAAENVKKELAGKLYSQEFLSRIEKELSNYRKNNSASGKE